MTQPIWRSALETQLKVHGLLVELVGFVDAAERDELIGPPNHTSKVVDSQWRFERLVLPMATPMGWSTDAVNACLAASKSVPTDTLMIAGNLPSAACWWWFEQPIVLANTKARALLLAHADGCLFCSAWVDIDGTTPELVVKKCGMEPGMVFTWKLDMSLRDSVAHINDKYLEKYPEAPAEHSRGLADFEADAELLSRFLLAANAWLQTKVLVQDAAHVERHFRKEFNKKIPSVNLRDGIKVVLLRKSERKEESGDGRKVDWSCRWEVDGHWRNQPHGAGRKETRLQWIMPYVKGPDDKPFVAKTTVMAAAR